jgi:cell division septum initiation protein DivIVA
VRELEGEVRDAERRADKLKAEWQERESAAESARAALSEAQREAKEAERRARK